MAQWKQTLEPYIKVQESIKTTSLQPTVGEDLIIGVTFISDAGPSTATLISGQKEFLSTYASQDLSQSYVESLNNLYSGTTTDLAATMWANAYRLAGSNTLLCVRASKSDNMYYTKFLDSTTTGEFIIKDGEILKKMSEFKFVPNYDGDGAYTTSDGWNIAINLGNGVTGIYGNRTAQDGTAMYDTLCTNLPDLISELNKTSVILATKVTYYTDVESTTVININESSSDTDKASVKSVVFDEVWMGQNVICKSDSRTAVTKSGATTNNGMAYFVSCTKDATSAAIADHIIDLDSTSYTNFTTSQYYATNIYNTTNSLRVRIRRFNHDAVYDKTISSQSSLTLNGESPYVVLTTILDGFTGSGAHEVSDAVRAKDFYEIAVYDKSLSEEVLFFNIGNQSARGDIAVDEINDELSMIQLSLPDDLKDLDLNYYGYSPDDNEWVEIEAPSVTTSIPNVPTVADLPTSGVAVGTIYSVGSGDTLSYYQYTAASSSAQIFCDLAVNSGTNSILTISDSDLKSALDRLTEDEVYVTEGLCDLGNTESSFQNYMANIAINDNYFYPISTINSTNYVVIGNNTSKISQESCKLYMSSPWDLDSGTLGWRYYAAPSVLYWETVARNRSNNNEFAGVLGQNNGIVSYQKPVTEFNKTSRQMLLSKRVNTPLWNVNTQAWNMNDNYTKQSTDNILSDDGNARLQIRISKSVPGLLKQYIGRKITEVLCKDMWTTLDNYFTSDILTLGTTVDAYNIICNYDETLAKKNKVKVTINVRYGRSLKWVEVYNNAFDLGMDISAE